jgi:hypothetical protein
VTHPPAARSPEGRHTAHGTTGVLALRLHARPRHRRPLAQDPGPSPRHRPALRVRHAAAASLAVASRSIRLSPSRGGPSSGHGEPHTDSSSSRLQKGSILTCWIGSWSPPATRPEASMSSCYRRAPLTSANSRVQRGAQGVLLHLILAQRSAVGGVLAEVATTVIATRSAADHLFRPSGADHAGVRGPGHTDDIAQLIRSIGPTIVLNVLLDGPQLTSRWTAR